MATTSDKELTLWRLLLEQEAQEAEEAAKDRAKAFKQR